MAPIIRDFEQGRSLVDNGIRKLLNILHGAAAEPFTSDAYMKMYTTIYNMCVQKPPYDFSQQLYDHYGEVFQNHCTHTIIPALRRKDGEFLLREFLGRWTTLKTMIRWMHHFFCYLDRYFVARRSLDPLKTVALDKFREFVYEKIKDKVRDVVITFIGEEREGAQVDHALLKNVLDVFVAMGKQETDYYESDFEALMLEDTARYYSRKASNWIGEDSCPEYMIKAEECLRKEKDRVSHYLHASSEVKLLSKAEHELLTKHRAQLLDKDNSGCIALLRDNKVEDLSRMHRLFSRVPVPVGLEPIASMFKAHVTAEGNSLVDAAANMKNIKSGKIDEQLFIGKLIQLHDRYLGYVKDCFLGHTLFHKAFKEAFEVFCNKNIADSASSEILSTFCDSIMKKGGSEKGGDEGMEETLDKVVALLAYFNEKDLFVEFSRKKLGRRLLMDKSTNEEYERSLLTKLKHQFGAQFTSKMEGMLTDLTLAREHQAGFEKYLHHKVQKHGIDLGVSVLTTGFWPTYKSSDINLPAEMVKCIDSFKEYYGTKTKQRKLTWIYSLGNCIVIGKFDSKQIELSMSTYQASLLLLFNDSDRLSYQEVKEQLNLSDNDVVRLLHSLSCGKYKILNKEPNTKTILPTDTFEFNSKFTDRMRRIKIPLPPVDEKKKVIEDVDKDRQYTIDASIVRIMKSRKVLGHQQLVLECTEQLQKMFKPDFKQIKKRIETLISREFLERDPENLNTYRYLA